MTSLSVHLLYPPDSLALNLLQRCCDPGISFTTGEPSTRTAYEVLVAGRPRLDHLTTNPNLRILVIPFAGLPEATRELLLGFPDLAVYNLHHNAGLTAEIALTLLLAAAKAILPCDRALRRNDWHPRYHPLPALSLEGKTILILGFGQVGQRIGRACHALGMRILALRRQAKQAAPVEYPVEIFDATMLH